MVRDRQCKIIENWISRIANVRGIWVRMNCSFGILIFVWCCSHCYSQAKLLVFKIACDSKRNFVYFIVSIDQSSVIKKPNIKKGENGLRE